MSEAYKCYRCDELLDRTYYTTIDLGKTVIFCPCCIDNMFASEKCDSKIDGPYLLRNLLYTTITSLEQTIREQENVMAAVYQSKDWPPNDPQWSDLYKKIAQALSERK